MTTSTKHVERRRRQRAPAAMLDMTRPTIGRPRAVGRDQNRLCRMVRCPVVADEARRVGNSLGITAPPVGIVAGSAVLLKMRVWLGNGAGVVSRFLLRQFVT